MSLVSSALNSDVDFCVANFPFFADLENYKINNWLMNVIFSEGKEKCLSNEELKGTLSYFDILNFRDVLIFLFL